MLLGHSQPALNVIVNGVTAINPGALIDGNPARVCRVPAGAANVQAHWTGAAPVRLIGLLGLTCPVGTTLTLTGRKIGGTNYTYALGTQAVVPLPDGSRAAWFVLAASTDPLIGVQVAWPSVGLFDIGELVVMQLVDLPHQPDWPVERIDPSVTSRTLGGQMNVVERRTYRRVKLSLTPADKADVRAAGLGNGMDWDTLAARLSGAARAVVIPRWRQPAGTLDVAEIHRTAVYGRVSWGAVSHLGGDQYTTNLTVEECPTV